MIEQNDRKPETLTSLQTAKNAVAILLEKKALDVKMYEVGEDNPMTDFYVNALISTVRAFAAIEASEKAS